MAQIKIGNLATDMRLENDWYGIRVLQRLSAFLAGFTPFSEQVVVSTPSTLTVQEWDAHNSMITLSIQGNIPYGQANRMTITALGTRLRIDGNFQIDPYSGTIIGWVNSESAYSAATNTLLVDISKIHEYVNSDSALDVEMNDATALAGSDSITSGNGHDYLLGYGGDDLLVSGDGADTLDGGPGNDIMKGGTGSDTYLVNSVRDVVIENRDSGTDTVQSLLGVYYLGPNLENLTLIGFASDGFGNAGNNTIRGNMGSNHISGGEGRDTMRGGAGLDTYFVDNSGDVVIELPGEGFDRVYSSTTFTLGENVEELILTGTEPTEGFGNTAMNTITGNDAANRLAGGSGNDLLSGGQGNDTLAGGLGRDTLTGYWGTDTFLFDTTPATGKVDTITDFGYYNAKDTIAFDRTIFTALGKLGLFGVEDARFYAAARANAGHDANDRMVYDTTSGALYYDADGSGPTAAVKVAILGTATHPLLWATDLLVV